MASWICAECNWANPDTVDKCRSCGTARPGAPTVSPGSSAKPPWYGDPAPRTPTSAAPSVDARGGLIGGLALGIGAAVMAAIAWYLVVALSQSQIAFVAILVGWFVGTAVVLGARRRVSLPLVVASPILTLLALAVSEYLIIYHLFTQEFGLMVEILQPIDVMIEIVVESVTSDPTTLIFWGLAVAAAAWIPFRAMREQVQPDNTYADLPENA
jgi:hypothetical protein